MVTCCDYIFLCGDTEIINVTERHFLFGAARGHKNKTISNAFVSCFLCFISSSRSFVNKD